MLQVTCVKDVSDSLLWVNLKTNEQLFKKETNKNPMKAGGITLAEISVWFESPPTTTTKSK